MAYLNLDDNFADHPKVEPLSDAAYRLHSASMLYSAKYLLDGYITPTQASKRPAYKPSILAELLRAGLWHERGEGCGTKTCPPGASAAYLIHDYLEWNKSRDWWEKKRRKDAERLAKWRAENGAQTEGETHG
jgi:hypothetical protein